MKVRYVKSTRPHPIITISQDTHRRLVELPFASDAQSSATLNEDGSISFAVRPSLHASLLDAHPDPDRAIQILLGLKTN